LTFVDFLLEVLVSKHMDRYRYLCIILPSGLCRDPSKEEHPRSDTDTATIVSEIESALSQVAKTGFLGGGGRGELVSQGFRKELPVSSWTC
jgi:hypothetical protein